MGGPVKSKAFKWLLDWIYDEKEVVQQAAMEQELAAQQARMQRANAMINAYASSHFNQVTNNAYLGQQMGYGYGGAGGLGTYTSSNSMNTAIGVGGFANLATAENKVKGKVKEALIDLEVYFFMPATGGYGNSGVPDFVACVEGRFFGIECKAGRNKTTALQNKHLDAITNAKGASLIIDETNMDNVKALILAKLGELQ